MKTIISIIIFCVVLFFYLHLLYHLKTSDDLELYTIDNPSKDKLEEICNLRQPVTFEFHIDEKGINRETIYEKFGAFDIRVRDVNDINNDYVPLELNVASKLFDSDNDNKYYTENNEDFLRETGVIKIIQYNDAFLRPHLVSNCNYDILYGSDKACTPFRYELNNRTFFYVNKGNIKIKLSPPKSSKYLYCQKDYENFEFRSLINPWNVQPQYQQDYNRTKSMDVVLHENAILFIPAYWWYSIQFNRDSEVVSMKYRTYMNNLAIAPHLFMGILQNQNVKINAVKNLASPSVLSQMKEVKSNDESNIGTTNIEDLAEKDEKILKNEKIEGKKLKTT